MDWKIIFAPQALEQLEQIVCFIAQDDPQAAVRFGDYLVERAELLTNFPEFGTPYRKRANVRRLLCRSYYIYYRVQPKEQAIEIMDFWRNFQHQPPRAERPLPQSTNTMPDLATAMKYNPDLRILLTGGYFDLAAPYYEGWYEMHHLPIPERLQDHIDYRYYQSGHMVYAHQESLKALHDDVAAFIQSTDHLAK